jgi:hypothetical protein
MNSAQRLLRVAVVVLVGIMIVFPPYLVREDVHATRWVSYGTFWQPPYPKKEATLPSLPYCPEGHASVLILLAQVTVLWMASSALYSRLGKIAFDVEKYPEYYRP